MNKAIFLFFLLFLLAAPFSLSQYQYTTVSTCSQLQQIENDKTDYYQLTKDIDCTNTIYWNDGAGFITITNFTGILDGGGYTIDGLYINTNDGGSADSYNGLFGINYGYIANMILTNINISSHASETGSIAGRNSGYIQNVMVTGIMFGNNTDAIGTIAGRHHNKSIVQAYSSVELTCLGGGGGCGGLAGLTGTSIGSGIYVKLEESAFTGSINASLSSGDSYSYVGGCIGASYGVSASNLYSQCDIYGESNTNIGGVAGQMAGTLLNSYSASDITIKNLSAVTSVGGLIGDLEYDSSAVNSFSASELTFNTGNGIRNGSLIGVVTEGSVSNCYALDADCIGHEESTTYSDCTSVVHTPYFYTRSNNPMNAWNFEYIWNQNDNGLRYPTLNFQSGVEVIASESLECDFPVLFCDDFNYDAPLYYVKEWNVINRDGSYDANFNPENEALNFTGVAPYYIKHFNPYPFSVNYTQSNGIIIYESSFAPSFSQEFDMYFQCETEASEAYFISEDFNGNECVKLKIKSDAGILTLYFYNETAEDYSALGTISNNTIYHMKINERFTAAQRMYLFGFNTSNIKNHFYLYINNTAYHVKESLVMNSQCDNIASFRIQKEDVSADDWIFIDNYYSYVGFDKLVNTISQEAIDVSVENAIITTIADDIEIIDSLESFYNNFGLKSDTSRAVLGIGLIVIFTIFLSIGLMTMGTAGSITVGTVAFIDFLLAIFLTYIKIFPVWILIIIALCGSGLGILALKYHMS